MQVSIVNEITFYLPNEHGELNRVTKALSDGGVNIKGMLVGQGFGKNVLRFVVDDADKAIEILKGIDVQDVVQAPILSVSMKTRPGAFSTISERLTEARVNMENIYVTESTEGDTVAYVNVGDEVDEAMAAFG